MIRPIESSDRADVARIAEASGLFSDDELVEVASMVDAFLGGELGEHHLWMVHEDATLDGVAYFAPEGFSDGVWNLYMLAVSPDVQGQGVGIEAVLAPDRAGMVEHGDQFRAELTK